MSTIDRSAPVASPPLVAGQRLDRVTFHERYERMPPNTRAELIGGVVHMPSPLSYDHADVNAPVVSWLVDYERATRGVRVTVNASTLLDDLGETQPDVSLRILPEHGGQTRIEGKYLAGASRAGRRDRPVQPLDRSGPEAPGLPTRRRPGISGGRAGARRGLLVRTPRRSLHTAPTRRRRPVPLGDFPRSLARCRGVVPP